MAKIGNLVFYFICLAFQLSDHVSAFAITKKNVLYNNAAFDNRGGKKNRLPFPNQSFHMKDIDNMEGEGAASEVSELKTEVIATEIRAIEIEKIIAQLKKEAEEAKVFLQ